MPKKSNIQPFVNDDDIDDLINYQYDVQVLVQKAYCNKNLKHKNKIYDYVQKRLSKKALKTVGITSIKDFISVRVDWYKETG